MHKDAIINAMSSRILVTGVNGFVGHHVASRLHDLGISVLGVSNQPSLQPDLVGVVDEYISCDLTDSEQVEQIDLANIAAIINLAGLAKIAGSQGQRTIYNKVNVGVHTVLYNECIRQNVSPRIIAISTGFVYDADQILPITEDSALAPKDVSNEYVISKQKMEEAIAPYIKKGLRIIIARPFNHSGPGQLPGFLLPDLGEQIVVAKSNKEPVMVGNLSTKRDYTDVRDVARAYVELATCDKASLKHGIYNICSGSSVEGRKILHLLIDIFGAGSLKVKIDPSRIRKNDVMNIYGSRDRITQDIGWEPKISLEKMIKDYAKWKTEMSS